MGMLVNTTMAELSDLTFRTAFIVYIVALIMAFVYYGRVNSVIEARREALAEQKGDAELARHFAPIAKALAENESTIVAELAEGQGKPADLGGYYHTDPAKVGAVMRPSATFNRIIG